MTKYIKKEDFERVLESSMDAVSNSFTESSIIKLIIGLLTVLFLAVSATIGLGIFIFYILMLILTILVCLPFVVIELFIRKKQ